MDKELLTGTFDAGKGAYRVEIKGGNFVTTVTYTSDELEAQVSVTGKSAAAIDKLKVLIPGKVDDFILDVIKGALVKG